MVMLYYKHKDGKTKRRLCTATALSSLYLATAAHCLPLDDQVVHVISYIVYVGTVDSTDGEAISVENVFPNTEYVFSAPQPCDNEKYDFAILKLSRPITSTSHFMKMSASINLPRENTYARVAGYGCLLYTSPSPRDLSTSRMPSSA